MEVQGHQNLLRDGSDHDSYNVEDAVRPAIKPSLAGLPREIRNMIYRHLLLNSRPIGSHHSLNIDHIEWDLPWTCHLQPAILRVCRQFYAEGCDILHGENTFGITIWDKYNQERATFLCCDHITEASEFRIPVRRFKNYDIVVQVGGEEAFWATRSSVRMVCEVLSKSVRLHHLRISLDDGYCEESVTRVLEPFALLRNVRRVDFIGVPPRYAEYLKDLMEGNTPRDHLPQMYRALLDFAGAFDHCEDDLQRACEAMEKCDSTEFKRVRGDIVRSVKDHMDFALDHLFDYDGKVEEDAPNDDHSCSNDGNSKRKWTDRESNEFIPAADTNTKDTQPSGDCMLSTSLIDANRSRKRLRNG